MMTVEDLEKYLIKEVFLVYLYYRVGYNKAGLMII